MNKKIEMVMAHALANYGDNGWDILIETQSVKEIESIIEGADTLDEAIQKAAEWCRINKEAEASVQKQVW